MTGVLEYRPHLDVVVCRVCGREMELPNSMGRDPESLMLWIEAKQRGHEATAGHQAAVKERKRQLVLMWGETRGDVIDRGLHTIHTRLQTAAGG